MEQANSVICICETHEQAQRAMYNLQEAEVDMGMLSIATRDMNQDPHDLDYYNLGDETFAVPGFGFLLVSGPLASWIATAFDTEEGGEGGSIVSTALETLGISPASVVQYETALRSDKFILVVHGPPDAVAKALAVIGGTTHCFHTVHGKNITETIDGNALIAKPANSYQL